MLTYHSTERRPAVRMRERILEFLKAAYGDRRTINVADDPRGGRIHVQFGGWACGAPFSVWVPLTTQGFKTVHRLCERARRAADEASKLDAQPTT